MENFTMLVLGIMLGIFIVGIIMSIVIYRKMSSAMNKMKKENKEMKKENKTLLLSLDEMIKNTYEYTDLKHKEVYDNLVTTINSAITYLSGYTDLCTNTIEEKIDNQQSTIDSRFDKNNSKIDNTLTDLKSKTAELIRRSFEQTHCLSGSPKDAMISVNDLIDHYRKN
jgi:predicted small secreted protein